ncbi:hypothetical protein [Thermosipho melanesiensis]|uniref:hypothetical protein n=1 Tax=Thermosipho melanesiensis TaxID=46541 RepID=UPI0015D6718F|nr:hypothetical protein [Thermosipho melanesiensis]
MKKTNELIDFVKKLEFLYKSYVNKELFDFLYGRDKSLRNPRYTKVILELVEKRVVV